MGQFTSKQWDEMTEVNKVVEEAKEEEHQKQSAGGKKSSLSQRVKTRILRSGNLLKDIIRKHYSPQTPGQPVTT